MTVPVTARVRLVTLLLAGLGAGLTLTAQDPPAGGAPQVFRGTVDFVYVDVYPRRNDQFVDGLQASDFDVFEDAAPQTIQTFERIRIDASPGARSDPRHADEAARWVGDPRRRLFVVYVDLYHITRSAAHFMRDPLIAFLKQTVGPTDVVVVMTPETLVSRIVFAGTLNTLTAQLAEYWEWGLADSAVVPRTPAEELVALCAKDMNGAIRRLRDIALFTSLESLMTRLSGMRDARTSVILLSEGWTNHPGFSAGQPGFGGIAPPPIGGGGRVGQPAADVVVMPSASCSSVLRPLNSDLERRFIELFQRARAANVAFYPIDVGGLRTYAADAAGSRPPRREDRRTLRELAENTSGFATVESNDLSRAFRRVTDSLSGYYLLGYASTNTARDGRFRSISVKVRQRGIDLTARRGYVAANNDVATNDAAPAATTVITRPVADTIGRLSRLDTDADLFASGVVSAAGIDIVAELAPRAFDSGRWRAGGSVHVELRSAPGGSLTGTARLDPGGRSVVLRFAEAAGQPGPWQAHVRVTGEPGEVTERITVGAPTSAIFGDPRLFRGPANTRLPHQPAALPRFTRGERMRVVWPLSMAAAPTTIHVLDRRGQRLDPGAALQASTSDDRTMVTADLHLAALAEGDYLLEVVTGQGPDQAQQLFAFRVAR